MSYLDQLKLLTAWDTEPAVSESELNSILADNALIDPAGAKPADAGWAATYDINAAAASVWLVKAARAAATVEVDPPGSGIVTSKVFDNCRKMARIFAGKRNSSQAVA
ncbi:MAG: hypothetical protein UZ17_ACD001001037 [Acidobacteria bacterium OLB17]|nr:MAG: hypothetical protein UZ17_ACD001001037 [Acidobacteria bacterium OLB17]MCZ2390991.1 hypothetical protein [Acidobacteriota bacterium]